MAGVSFLYADPVSAAPTNMAAPGKTGCGAEVIAIGDATGAANILKAIAEGYAAANGI